MQLLASFPHRCPDLVLIEMTAGLSICYVDGQVKSLNQTKQKIEKIITFAGQPSRMLWKKLSSEGGREMLRGGVKYAPITPFSASSGNGIIAVRAAAPLVQKVHVNYRKGRWASRSRGHSISMAAAQMQRRGK